MIVIAKVLNVTQQTSGEASDLLDIDDIDLESRQLSGAPEESKEQESGAKSFLCEALVE